MFRNNYLSLESYEYEPSFIQELLEYQNSLPSLEFQMSICEVRKWRETKGKRANQGATIAKGFEIIVISSKDPNLKEMGDLRLSQLLFIFLKTNFWSTILKMKDESMLNGWERKKNI